MIKVIVAGTRTFNDYELLCSKLDWYMGNSVELFEIVSGCARGADELGEKYAEAHNIPVKRFPADWKNLGKRAGYIRNAQMADYASHCVVFWDGVSKGTKLMIDLARERQLVLRVVNYGGDRHV